MAPKVERVTEIPSLKIGEGPHWDDETESLYFVDLLDKSIHKFVPSTGQYAKVVFDKVVSFIIPVQGKRDQFVITQDRDVVIVTWDGISEKPYNVQKIAELDSGSRNRLNDGKCDPTGRLWTGTLNYEEGRVQPEAGSLFSLSKGVINIHATKISISNGLAWNAKLKKFYYIDSFAYSVDAFDYDSASGTISNRTKVFTLPHQGIDTIGEVPDGMTIDADGNLWVAVFNGSKVIKIDPRKPDTLLQSIEIPAKQVTSVIWGGTDLNILYVTTGNLPNEKEELVSSDNGAIFKVTDLGTKGLPGVNFIL